MKAVKKTSMSTVASPVLSLETSVDPGDMVALG